MSHSATETAPFFPQPIFAEPPLPSAAINLPIFADTPPEEEIELLSWDDIVASEEEGAEFLGKIADYCAPVPLPEDINMRFIVAYELLDQAQKIIGTHGIKIWCAWREHFDQGIKA